MRKLSLLLAIVALLGTTAVATAQVAGPGGKMTILFSPGRDGNQMGWVSLEPVGSTQTKVIINMPSGGAGISQPAHIHVGSCPGVGAVAFPLTNVMDGKSETTVNVTAAQIMASQHSINVHKSTTEAGLYTACTNLPFMTATSLLLPFGPGRDGNQPGTVLLSDSGAQTKVLISAVSGGAGISQPAHIHAGTCPGVGGVDFPLTNLMNGASDTAVNATRATIMSKTRAINVHKSTTESAIYTACVDLPVLAAQAAPAPAQLPRTGGAPLGLLALLGGAVAIAGYVARRRS